MNRGLLLPLLAVTMAAAPVPEAPQVFVPTADLDLPRLTELVARGSAALQEQQLAVELSEAEVHQSRLLENPTVDFSVGTLPLGTTNPPDLPSPLTQVPNYGVSLGYHLDLLRRGPRQDRARALLRASRWQLRSAAHERALGLAQVLGSLATVALRLEGERSLIEDARSSLQLAQSRAQTGFGTLLEVDRMEIELLRLEQQLKADEGQAAATLAGCSELLAVSCAPFASTTAARGFIESWLERSRATIGRPVPIGERADLRALQSIGEAAVAEASVARRSAVPDPSLRIGYLYDSFVVSGNHQHSIFLGLSLPVPLFDHGQAALQAAVVRAARARLQRDLLLSSAQARIAALRGAFALQLERKQALQEKVIPRARAILKDASRAFEARVLRLTDLIQARRGLDDLLVAEADSLNDAFKTTLDLLGQMPEDPGAGPRTR